MNLQQRTVLHRMLAGMACVAMAVALPAAEADQPARRPARAANPSLAAINDVAGLPRVLLIGDSISIGYTLAARELLKDKANVHRIPTNGGPTTRGVESIDSWLGDGRWDVIHFNWGLHDLKYMDDGKHQVSIENYEKNLRALVKRMQATGAKLVWCSTTPVPEGNLNPKRLNADVERYNEVARRVMAEAGVTVSDLYAYALPKLAEIQRPQNVHFTDKGSAVLAQHVAQAIQAQLPAK